MGGLPGLLLAECDLRRTIRATRGNPHVAGLHRMDEGLLSFMPDGRYEVKSFATDAERNSVCAYGVFSATHTGEGGPCPPTGNSTNTDYVYVMESDGDKIRHMTKIWNAGWAMRELGWT